MNASMSENWWAAAFATGPADRDQAEAGVRAAYSLAGLAEPDRLIWLPSPAHGAIAAALLADRRTGRTLEESGLGDFTSRVRAELGADEAGRSVRDLVRTLPWEAARAAAYAELGPREWPAAWARTGGRMWDQVSALVARIRRGIADLGDGAAESPLRGACVDAVLGQHDAPWLALFDTLGRFDGLTGLAGVARSAGWWWPYERLAIICERPSELHRDEPGRLHRGDGPALCYPDGFALYAWRGMPMPADFAGMLSGLTATRIAAEQNAELRRVMLEHYGYDRYLADTGATPVHRDETGVLWRIDLFGDEPIAMVEVINSTPEPDGTRRTYHLRVPPRTRTAREGVAWTFGVEEADYRPERQT